MRRCIVTVLLLATMPTIAQAVIEEPIYVIDSPTAGLLAHGEYHVQGRVGPASSILLGMRLGIKDLVHVGVSFGMQNVFERADISVNDVVGFQARLRLIQETTSPALAIGFNNQGVGIYDEDLKRYERKSKGFYGVLSKNWRLFVGQLSLHGGANYSLEREDQDNVSLFSGIEYELVKGFSLIGEFDAALNDDHNDGTYGRGGGYLDAGVRVNYGENLSMLLIFRDLTGNYGVSRHVGREFEISFIDLF